MRSQKKIRQGGLWLSVLVLAAVLVLLPYPSGAVEKTWVGGSGWWNDPSQWDPPGQPQDGDDVNIIHSGATDITVQYRNSLFTETELGHLFIDATDTGTVEFLMEEDHVLRTWVTKIADNAASIFTQSNGSHIVDGGLSIASYRSTGSGIYELIGGSLQAEHESIGGVGTGSFIQRGGTNTADLYIVLGQLSYSTGTYELHGGELETELLGVGESGQGTFIQTGGSSRIAEHLYIGYNNFEYSTTGLYELQNGNLEAGAISIGGYDSLNWGIGTFDQTGGSNTVNQTLTVGAGAIGDGTYLLSRGSLQSQNTIVGDGCLGDFTQSGGGHTVLGDLKIAVHDLASYTLSGGDLLAENQYVGHGDLGLFNHSEGTNTVNRALILGKEAGSEGTYLLSGGILSAFDIKVGDKGSGFFQQTRGTIFCENSLEVMGWEGDDSFELQDGNLWAQFEIVGFAGSGSGSFTQSGGQNSISDILRVATAVPGNYALSGDASLEAGREAVGVASTGTFTQTEGTNQITTYLILGVRPDGEGTYSLSGGSLSASELFVGSEGTGNFIQEGGVTTLSNDLFLGYGIHPDFVDIFIPVIGSGNYTLSGGSLEADNQYVGYLGAGGFSQTGGRNFMNHYLYLGFEAGSRGRYSLGGDGVLLARNEAIGAQGEGDFTQEAGRNSTWNMVLGSDVGGIGTYALRGGVLRAKQEGIGLYGTGTFTQTGGENRIRDLLILGVYRGSSGEYLLRGGTLETGSLEVTRRGTFTQTGGKFTSGPLINAGEVNMEGGLVNVTGDLHNQNFGQLNISVDATFPGNTTNDGTIKTTDATVTWDGKFSNNGIYISDPSTQIFTDLVVGPEGCLVGYSQDLFVVTGDLEVHSTQNYQWQTDQATLQFLTVINNTDTEITNVHAFQVPGEDRGPDGGAHNFRWGTLIVEGVSVHLLDGNQTNQGSALYVGHIEGLEIDENTLTVLNIYGPEGLYLYYDPVLNPDLQGLIYSLRGINSQVGGKMMPTPVPASVLLLGTGLLGLGAIGWRRKRG